MNKPGRNTQRRDRKKTSRSQKTNRHGLIRFFSSIPTWGIWLGAILVALAYAFIFYYFFVDPYSFRWDAIYGKPQYPEGYNIRGVDISHYQERIDWTRLRNAQLNNNPVRFVIIKATEGASLFDDNFNDNFYQAKKNDLIRGAYHFYIPGVSASKQADFFLHQVHLEPGDLPPVLDVEKAGNLSKNQIQKDVLIWLNKVEKHYGVKPILYTSYKFKTDYLNDTIFNQYPYWIAHYYVKELQYKGPWIMWQHTDCGKVDGIRGHVDCNIFNGSLEDLMNFTLPDESNQIEEELETI